MSWKLVILTWILFMWCGQTSASIQCRDMKGKAVDWFIVYKLPKNHSELTTSGADFLYMDAKKQSFQTSPIPLDNENQAIGHTLNQIYSNPSQDVRYGMYNDQPPPTRMSVPTKGHTKGVLAFDSTTGFWMVHSVPNFTNPHSGQAKYEWPENAREYGQMFMCISVPYQQFEVIGFQLMWNCPHVYDSYLSDKDKNSLPNLPAALSGKCNNLYPYNNIASVTTIGGRVFTSFTKSVGFNEDLYSSLVAPVLKSDIYTETWRRNNMLKSYCGNYTVENVQSIRLPGTPHKSSSFESTEDHAKWAITSNQSVTNKWVCVGDINTEDTQFRRAGGTVCLNLPKVWSAFFNLVYEYECCSGMSMSKENDEERSGMNAANEVDGSVWEGDTTASCVAPGNNAGRNSWNMLLFFLLLIVTLLLSTNFSSL